jgi:hypothetical protein
VMNVHRSNGVLLGDKSNKRFISFPGQAWQQKPGQARQQLNGAADGLALLSLFFCPSNIFSCSKWKTSAKFEAGFAESHLRWWMFIAVMQCYWAIY